MPKSKLTDNQIKSIREADKADNPELQNLIILSSRLDWSKFDKLAEPSKEIKIMYWDYIDIPKLSNKSVERLIEKEYAYCVPVTYYSSAHMEYLPWQAIRITSKGLREYKKTIR